MATQTVGRGLSPADLARIRETLAAGRRPKVVFTQSAGQIAGQIGQVVELTDPDGSDEFVVVRFGRDELPFSPADLAVPPRAPTRRAAAAVPEQQPRRDEPVAVESPEPVPDEPAKEQPMPSSPTSTASKPKAAAPKSAPEPKPVPEVNAVANGSAPPAPPPAPEPAPPVTEPAPAPAPKARKSARPKPAPSLTITVTYADGEWMVTATQGAKTLAKPYVLRPAEALRMVALLDVPGVHEAVEDIVSAARDEAQRQADRLRAELAEVESRLAELRETP